MILPRNGPGARKLIATTIEQQPIARMTTAHIAYGSRKLRSMKAVAQATTIVAPSPSAMWRTTSSLLRAT